MNKKTEVSSIILLNEHKEVLLQKKDLRYTWFPGMWCLPGGGLESKETPTKAIKREIEEELGWQLEDFEYVEKEEYKDQAGEKTKKGTQHIFHSNISPIAISNLRFREGAGFAFFAESELNTIPIVEHDLKRILNFYEKLRKTQ